MCICAWLVCQTITVKTGNHNGLSSNVHYEMYNNSVLIKGHANSYLQYYINNYPYTTDGYISSY